MHQTQQIGTVICDRYRIVGVLGQGGTSTTYEAEVIDTSQRVALKELSLRGLSDWKKLTLFEREAKVLQSLDHAAIPDYIDYFQIDTADNRFFYIVQELVKGKSLAELVEAGKRFSEADVWHIALTVLEILQYLHELNPPVIHRDIKPQNIIRHQDGRIFLVDFGAVQTVHRHTIAFGSTVVGTFGYMAPEQLQGYARPTTDLFGLGATLLNLLTHQPPSNLPQKRLKYDFRPHVTVSARFAGWLDGLLEPLLEERHQSARQAIAALAPLRSAPVKSAPVSRDRPKQVERTPLLFQEPPKNSKLPEVLQVQPSTEEALRLRLSGAARQVTRPQPLSSSSRQASALMMSTAVIGGVVLVSMLVLVMSTGNVFLARMLIFFDTYLKPADGTPSFITGVAQRAELNAQIDLQAHESILPTDPRVELESSTEFINPDELKTFSDWCMNRTSVGPALRATVNAMLLSINMKGYETTSADPVSYCAYASLRLNSYTKSFGLTGNQITDLRPVASLRNLKSLHLTDNEAEDLSPLMKLTNLEVLAISGNKISDVSPLANLDNLRYLNLADNQVTDVAPLSKLANLSHLALNDNQITNITSLAGLTDLYILVLGDNLISDLTPLAHLTGLERLYFSNNLITDASPLAGLTNLENLDLSGNPLRDPICPVRPTNVCRTPLDKRP